jgi:hypothetical protein
MRSPASLNISTGAPLRDGARVLARPGSSRCLMAEEETKALPRYPNPRPIKPGEARNPVGRNGKIGLGELREFLAELAEPASRHSRRGNLLLALYTTAIDRRRRDGRRPAPCC